MQVQIAESPAIDLAGRRNAEGVAIPNSSGIKRDISVRLTILARLLRNDFDRQMTGYNITRSQWSLIVVVARYPGATQRQIAEALEISEASAGRLIDRLCADGLLSRNSREDDRRARSVHLTTAAEPLSTKLADIAQIREEKLFRGFQQNELDALQDYLNRIHRNISGD